MLSPRAPEMPAGPSLLRGFVHVSVDRECEVPHYNLLGIGGKVRKTTVLLILSHATQTAGDTANSASSPQNPRNIHASIPHRNTTIDALQLD